MSNFIKSARPYKLGGIVDDTRETEACILYLAYIYFKSYNLDLRKIMKDLYGYTVDLDYIIKIAHNKVVIPTKWDLIKFKFLCYDLMDIKKHKLAHFIEEWEEVGRYKYHYQRQREVKKKCLKLQ